MRLAIFDFDGTITYKDSFIGFIVYAVGLKKSLLGLFKLLPVLISYKLKLIPNQKAKESVVNYFFKGWPEEEFNRTAFSYSTQEIPKLINPTAWKKIEWHKKEGHRIIVVSASLENYLLQWCQQNGLDLIATKVEVENGRLTGRLKNKNCHGDEKICRIKEIHNLKDFDYIYAYGDTEGDKKLAQIANKFFYRKYS